MFWKEQSNGLKVIKANTAMEFHLYWRFYKVEKKTSEKCDKNLLEKKVTQQKMVSFSRENYTIYDLKQRPYYEGH